MAINSRTKGKQGELEIAHLLKDHGIEARRGQQFSGSPDSPDVVADMPGIHIEVKRVESFNLRKAMEQAERDADGKTPVVFQRGNRQRWVTVLYLEDFLRLYKEAKDGRTEGD